MIGLRLKYKTGFLYSDALFSPTSIASSHIICPSFVIVIASLINSNFSLSRNFDARTYRIASIF